jgi:hypothetical protein
MSRAPSKFLYACGGWLLGGLVGGLAAAALVVGATALGASAATVTGLVSFGEFAAIGTRFCGHSFKPEIDCGDIKKGHEAERSFIVAGGDATEVL